MVNPKRCVALSSLIIMAFVTSAEAQRIRLNVRMGQKDQIQATAKYEQRGNRAKFNLELEDATPSATYGIRILRNNNIIDQTTITTNRFGVAEIDIDTSEGDTVPILQRGDVVQVWQNQTRVLQGSLQGK